MRKSFGLLLLLVIYLALFYFQTSNKKNYFLDFGVAIPKGFESLGIDLSHHQGAIRWSELVEYFETKQLSFAYIKATEGINHVDTKWTYNRNECRKYRIQFGAYHFYQPNLDGEAQAKHFIKNYQFETGDLPPVLDVEIESNQELLSGVKRWVEYVEKEMGVRPIIYTSKHFYHRFFQKEFKNTKFWIASYSRNPGIEQDDRIIHWQFTEKAKVSGIDGYVDMNVSKLRFIPNLKQE